MADALIGHTGFVGSNLARQHQFDFCYNSKNIEDIREKSFDLVVCAGVQSKKWWANEHPLQDWWGISRLWDSVRTIRVRRFVLISTVDVYAVPRGVDEDTRPTTKDLHWYGINRLMLETFVADQFERAQIVRLPALFGSGLKKNALFDLMHNNQTEKIPENAEYQWYPIYGLWRELSHGSYAKMQNFTSDPIPIRELRDRFFPNRALGPASDSAPKYDVRSRWDWEYRYEADEIMAELEGFVQDMACLT